ncbi:MAG: alpha-amylase family glycosyl hydrolase [Prevotella sp.]
MDKIIIYQMFTRLFGNNNVTRKHNGSLEENGAGKFNDIDTPVLRRIKSLGCTHVWFTGVIRHATTHDYSTFGMPANHPAIVKGKAGSPYAITDYYDVDPDMAVNVPERMMEYEGLIARTHKSGMKVIMDFVPNHVAREYHSISCPEGVRDLGADDNVSCHFSVKNNFYYCWDQPFAPQFDIAHDSDGNAVRPYCELPAKATGNDVFSACPSRNDWYETVKLNYGVDYCDAGGRSEHFYGSDGRPEVDTWLKMTDILLYWASKGVDAFRCDMAEMVPSAFWSYATSKVRERYPDIKFIGEVYDPSQYRTYIGAGFDYLYDKVGMYDTLRGVTCGCVPATEITRRWQETDDISGNMLYFLENHDEQRVASDFFAGEAVRGVPALIVSVLMRTNPFMLYAGEEFGERGMDAEGFSGRDGRTTIFDYWCVDTIRRGYFSRRELSKDERALEKTHSLLLNLATNDAVFTTGAFYDLMYANPYSQAFDSNVIYAFLRKSKDSLALVAVNFSGKEMQAGINIPPHAFEYLGIGECEVSASELLSGEERTISIRQSSPVHVTIPAHSGVILKMSV